LNINYKTNKKTWTNPQIKTTKIAMNSGCSDHRYDTRSQNTCI